MKILVLDPSNFEDFPTGGHLSFVRNMLKAYSEDELALVGITTDPFFPVGKWIKRTIDNKTFDYFAFLYRPKKSDRPFIPARFSVAFSFFRYREKILKYKFNVIFFQPFEFLLVIPRSYLAQTIIYIPGLENPLRCSRYLFARKLSKIYDIWYYNRVKYVKHILAAASSEAIEEFAAIGKNIVPIERIHQFPTRFDRDSYHFLDLYSCRKKLDIPPDIPMIVTVGRLAEFKGWKLMLDAFSIFQKDYPSARFYFIGDGEDKLIIQSEISSLDLEKSCYLVGRKLPSEISLYLNASSLFVMGSLFEGWSTTLVEACACGVPCVVTEYSSSKEMIKNGKNGFIVTRRDPRLFADLMKQAMKLLRQDVVEYDKRYNSLAVQMLPESLGLFFK